jgi:hypothetical protein
MKREYDNYNSESPPLDKSRLYNLYCNFTPYIQEVESLRQIWLRNNSTIWGLFNNIPEMALHNEEHSKNLEKLLTEFFHNIPICPKRKFIYIWASSWLHDVGLFQYASEIINLIRQGKCKVSENEVFKVRDKHGELSYDRIRREGQDWGLKKEDIEKISTICKYHTSKSTEELKEKAGDLISKKNDIPLFFFIILLRMLDALDIQKSRWAPEPFRKILDILELSKRVEKKDPELANYLEAQTIHLIKHASFISVRINDDSEIVYLPNFEMPLLLIIYSFAKAYEDIQRHLEEINFMLIDRLGNIVKDEVKGVLGYEENEEGKIKIGPLTINSAGYLDIHEIRLFEPLKDDLYKWCDWKRD